MRPARAGGAARRLRGRPDVQPLRGDVPGEDARARDGRHVRQAALGARLSVGADREARERFFEEIRTNWGGPVGIEARGAEPRRRSRVSHWWSTYLRLGASPGAALALTQMNAEIDVRDVLPSCACRHSSSTGPAIACLLVEEGRYVAGLVPGARFVELPGDDHLPFVGDQDAIIDEIAAFLSSVTDRPARTGCSRRDVRAHRQRPGRTTPTTRRSPRTSNTRSHGSAGGLGRSLRTASSPRSMGRRGPLPVPVRSPPRARDSARAGLRPPHRGMRCHGGRPCGRASPSIARAPSAPSHSAKCSSHAR